MVRFRIRHQLMYNFRPAARVSHVATHLTPSNSASQKIHHHAVEVRPAPDSFREGVDAFGNRVNWISVERNHPQLTFTATTDVTVQPNEFDITQIDAPWEHFRQLATESDRLDVRWCRLASPLVPLTTPHHRPVQRTIISDWRRVFTPNKPLNEVVADLQLHVVSLADDTQRAHATISACRQFGLSARFAWGYVMKTSDAEPIAPQTLSVNMPADLKTAPTTDETLQRSAWVSVWTDQGWNDLIGSESTPMVMIAAARDAHDVQPITSIAVGTTAPNGPQEEFASHKVVDVS